MQSKRWFAIAAVLVAVAMPVANAKSGENSVQKKAIFQVMEMQANAWNRGDVDGFMVGYLNSPDTSYTSGGAQVWGYEAIKQRYVRTYGAGDRKLMGKLEFSNLKVVEATKDSAVCVGEWHLTRAKAPKAEGVFSLVFVRTPSGWKIIHDHTTAGIKKTTD